MLELITAIIKPHQLDEVKEAMLAVGVEGLSITEIRGFGRQRGKTETFRGSEYQVAYLPKVKIEVVVSSDIADQVTEAIASAAHTGKIGDGKIWRIEVASILRVRTGEQGTDAL